MSRVRFYGAHRRSLHTVDQMCDIPRLGARRHAAPDLARIARHTALDVQGPLLAEAALSLYAVNVLLLTMQLS